MENQEVQLIEQQKSYDLVVTSELEDKIRFLCSKLPKNEYSGTLFYTIEGSFKDDNLKIIAKDFFLQDVGGAAYTEFKNDVDLAGYMASHELWDCYTGLMHSHNEMSAFFSGTDIATLKEEGKDANHFVSLIVNNAGKYCASITKKVNFEVQGTRTSYYNSFDDELVNESPTSFTNSSFCIEYYHLNIIMPEAADRSELEERLEELKNSSSSYINKRYTSVTTYENTIPTKTEYPYKSSIDRVNPKEVKEPKQLEIFKKDSVQEDIDIPYGTVHINPEIISNSVLQIITGDLFSIYKQSLDLDKWASNMQKLYDKRFGSADNENFKFWVDTVLDFLVEEAQDGTLLEEGEDYMWAIWAYDMIAELEQFPENDYLKTFINSLNRWLI